MNDMLYNIVLPMISISNVGLLHRHRLQPRREAGVPAAGLHERGAARQRPADRRGAGGRQERSGTDKAY